MAEYAYEPTSLEGKNVVVTGGTTGIGRSTTQALLARGANVLIFGRHEKELNDALTQLKDSGKGKLFGLNADHSKSEDVEKVFQEVDTKLGGIDVLINNAAISGESLLEMDLESCRYLLDSNIFGYLACTKLAVARMQAKGEGHIVYVGSMSADEKEPDGNVYVATKCAVRGFSESFRKEVNEMGIKVTLIEPGSVGTDMVSEETPPEKQRQEQEAGRMLKAEDIAECICFALTQPARCDVVEMQVRPIFQLI